MPQIKIFILCLFFILPVYSFAHLQPDNTQRSISATNFNRALTEQHPLFASASNSKIKNNRLLALKSLRETEFAPRIQNAHAFEQQTPYKCNEENKFVRGIYITQPMLESTKNIKHLIKNAKKYKIDTFIIDFERFSKIYDKNIQLVKDANIRYVTRIVVFPNGGTKNQVKSVDYWEKKYKLIKHAVELGAAAIQLDYIRYNTKQPRTHKNVTDIYQVIKWYKDKLNGYNVKLQIDVFGETSYSPSLAIGQDIIVFADLIDSLNPMVYPSHYFPYHYHSARPYETVYDSLMAINEQFHNDLPFKVHAYIEVNNFRYRYPTQKRMEYIYQQIKAVQDAGADGWYAWSPTNKYHILFKTLETYKLK